jgi:tetratricopeptide (TPR) repeat protein
MKLASILNIFVIGTLFAIAAPKPIAALTPQEVQEIAEEVTVLIPAEWVNYLGEREKANGSGSIIAREGNTYTVLTANHVVCGDQNPVCENPNNLKIVTHDGKSYEVDNRTIKKLPDIDLAVLEFTSNRNYKLATLGNYPLIDEQYVFASGWPAPNRYFPKREYFFSVGKVLPKDIMNLLKIFPIELGYDLVYTSLTYGGVSGGPVFDSKGQVIAVHGMNEKEEIEEYGEEKTLFLPIGFSASIPIKMFFELAPQAGIEVDWQESKTPPDVQKANVEVGISFVQQFEELASLESGGSTSVDWANYANRMWRRGMITEALRGYDRALEINPNFYQAWYGKALTYTYWRKYDEALQAYDRALEMIPADADNKQNIVALRQKLVDFLESRANSN